MTAQSTASPPQGPISFGLLYDMRNPAQWRREWSHLYAETLDFIAWSEAVGFNGAWVPEHHVTGDGSMASPLVALAAIAARTSRMTIGCGIALAPFHHPVRFAEDCALVDQLSGGRLQVGLGLGYRRRESDAYGIDFASRPGRMDEFLEIVRRLWNGERVTFAGKHFHLRDAAISPGPVGRIPLLVGAYSRRAMTRVARYGDGYIGAHELYDTYLEALVNEGRPGACARFSQASMPFVVAEDPERAMAQLAPYYHYVNNAYGDWLAEDGFAAKVSADNAPRRLSLDEFKTSGILQIVTPDEAIAFFEEMRRKTAVENVTIAVPPGIPLKDFLPYVQLFAEKVIPNFGQQLVARTSPGLSRSQT